MRRAQRTDGDRPVTPSAVSDPAWVASAPSPTTRDAVESAIAHRTGHGSSTDVSTYVCASTAWDGPAATRLGR